MPEFQAKDCQRAAPAATLKRPAQIVAHEDHVEYIDNGKIVKETLKTVDEMGRKRIGDIVNNYDIRTMHTKEATLEEIFIQVTGRELVYNETVK